MGVARGAFILPEVVARKTFPQSLVRVLPCGYKHYFSWFLSCAVPGIGGRTAQGNTAPMLGVVPLYGREAVYVVFSLSLFAFSRCEYFGRVGALRQGTNTEDI
jgi:hypothetical protein